MSSRRKRWVEPLPLKKEPSFWTERFFPEKTSQERIERIRVLCVYMSVIFICITAVVCVCLSQRTTVDVSCTAHDWGALAEGVTRGSIEAINSIAPDATCHFHIERPAIQRYP